MLEVGTGHGRIGEAIEYLGFDVTSTDGRPEHVHRMKVRGKKAQALGLDGGGDTIGAVIGAAFLLAVIEVGKRRAAAA